MTIKSANGRAILEALRKGAWAALCAREVLTTLSLVLLNILFYFVFLKFFPPQNPTSLANVVTLVCYLTTFPWMIFSYVFFVDGGDHARALYAVVVSKHPPLAQIVLGFTVPGYVVIEKFTEVSLGIEIGLPAWLMPRVFGIDPLYISVAGWGLLGGVCFAVFCLAAVTQIYAKAGPEIELRNEETRCKEKRAVPFRHRLAGYKAGSAIEPCGEANPCKPNPGVAFRYNLGGYVVTNLVLLVAILAGWIYAETVTLTARGAPASDKTVSACFKDKSRIHGEPILTTDKIVVFKTATSLEAYPHDQISHASCEEFAARQGEPTSANTSIVFFRDLLKQE